MTAIAQGAAATAATASTATSGEAPLSARGITLGYDGRPVAADLHLEIEQGSFTVIVGPNACGKSTLLRALSRLLRPTQGQVVLDGRDITE